MSEPRTEIPGSARTAWPSAETGTVLDPATPIEVTVVVRRPAQAGDIEAVSSVAVAAGAEVLDADPVGRRVRLRGSAGALSALFGTELSVATLPGSGSAFRHRSGPLSVPAQLDGIVTAVLGLDNRPQARTRSRIARTATASFTPLQLATTYHFPADTDGTGQTVAIIELGGGFGASDLDPYFAGLGVPAPTVTAVGVDGAQNQPGRDPQGADGEVLLDIEVVGALAPKATILVYFAPNTDAGFLDAVTTASHATPTPVAISISWGQSEDEWTAQARKAMDDAFTDACELGITVTAAAGDDGSADRATDHKVHVDFPAASPHVLACGGTRLAVGADGQATSETVWGGVSGGGATGGGVSDSFALPSWQASVGVPALAGGGAGRGVPDVAAVADPATGYQIRVDGSALVIGGTSAVAPLWAALVCRLAQALGRPLGQLQPALYAGVAAGTVGAGFRDVTTGSNGAYSAAPGWDACTGLGVPDGEALLARLRG